METARPPAPPRPRPRSNRLTPVIEARLTVGIVGPSPDTNLGRLNLRQSSMIEGPPRPPDSGFIGDEVMLMKLLEVWGPLMS